MQCEIVGKYFSVMNQILDKRKSPMDYGSGRDLYHAELVFLEQVHLNPHSNAQQLSELLGVTRGAITQLGNKLEKKELVCRYTTAGNKKEKYYALTELGIEVCRRREAYHQDANLEMCSYLSSLRSQDRELILEFLEKLRYLPINDFECNSPGLCNTNIQKRG